MSRAHTEIACLSRRITIHLRMADEAGALKPDNSTTCAPVCMGSIPFSACTSSRRRGTSHSLCEPARPWEPRGQ